MQITSTVKSTQLFNVYNRNTKKTIKKQAVTIGSTAFHKQTFSINDNVNYSYFKFEDGKGVLHGDTETISGTSENMKVNVLNNGYAYWRKYCQNVRALYSGKKTSSYEILFINLLLGLVGNNKNVTVSVDEPIANTKMLADVIIENKGKKLLIEINGGQALRNGEFAPFHNRLRKTDKLKASNYKKYNFDELYVVNIFDNGIGRNDCFRQVTVKFNGKPKYMHVLSKSFILKEMFGIAEAIKQIGLTRSDNTVIKLVNNVYDQYVEDRKKQYLGKLAFESKI